MAGLSAGHSVALLVVIVGSLLLAEQRLVAVVQAAGDGDKIIWREATLLAREMDRAALSAGAGAGAGDDSVYLAKLDILDEPEAGAATAHSEVSSFEELVRKVRVELVAPQKDLLRLMNLVSTRTRAMFLADYQRYFQQLKVGTTSRPVLMAHLGLEWATREQVGAWARPVAGQLAKVRQSCSELVGQHEQALAQQLNERDLEIIRQARNSGRTDRLGLAYLVFRNNLNLFMLENFVLLCAKLPDEVGGQQQQQQLGGKTREQLLDTLLIRK